MAIYVYRILFQIKIYRQFFGLFHPFDCLVDYFILLCASLIFLDIFVYWLLIISTVAKDFGCFPKLPKWETLILKFSVCTKVYYWAKYTFYIWHFCIGICEYCFCVKKAAYKNKLNLYILMGSSEGNLKSKSWNLIFCSLTQRPQRSLVVSLGYGIGSGIASAFSGH